jgi:hypothetical protein
MSRRPAFDPSRLDDLDELLPTPTLVPPSGPASAATPTAFELQPEQGSGEPEQTTPAPTQPSGEPAPMARRARGQGGRPPEPRSSRQSTPDPADGTRVPVAVRIPRPLYEEINTGLLAGPEHPSYGQLVVWTCEDHPDDVVAEVRAARPQPGSRRPRGRRLAAETVQVTLRLTMKERGLVDDIADAVRATHPGLVTRTEVATAALRYALEAPPAT